MRIRDQTRVPLMRSHGCVTRNRSHGIVELHFSVGGMVVLLELFTVHRWYGMTYYKLHSTGHEPVSKFVPKKKLAHPPCRNVRCGLFGPQYSSVLSPGLSNLLKL